MNIKITKNNNPKIKPNFKELGFGKYFTDHMFQMEYVEGEGWQQGEILPYSPISLDPSTSVFHYAQEVFEGLKAYIDSNGNIRLFRPKANAVRFQNSCKRLHMAELPVESFVTAIEELVKLEKDWIPTEQGTSLYIRPFMIASEAFLGVHPSCRYKFIIILSPVGDYYPEGINPVKIYVEDFYSRAAKGGTGDIKCGGNYAASISAQMKAKKLGYSQVLWLDSSEKKYIEEVGTMNVFFKIDDTIYTPPLNGSILPGITRDSALELLKDWGCNVSETPIEISELLKAGRDGRVKEAWGTGTAAVISPIGELAFKDVKFIINNSKIGEITEKLYNTLTGIQYGKIHSPKDWSVIVK